MQIFIIVSLHRYLKRISGERNIRIMKSLAIEREFGSGGREIGKRVAELAGIPYYDGEMLIKEVEERGIALDLLREYDEQKTGSILYNIALFVNYNQDIKQDKVYEVCYHLQETIRNLAMRGPAVFIGRCSTEILKENPRAVRAYIYSSEEQKKIERIIRTEDVSREEAQKLMERKDRQRKAYFKFWTQKKWSDRNNYDMELNTAVFSVEECSKILLCAMQQ